ncbi:unnamed protein product [Cuscuta epithymum]|uniref:Uncharacterized protein n=1 Tax=Cuscuta epithymum TaxID=186058 RepID=A0AAV0D219_9ASTE|nr:unnamed protein product [Cuscuta epithymum]
MCVEVQHKLLNIKSSIMPVLLYFILRSPYYEYKLLWRWSPRFVSIKAPGSKA